MFPLFATCVVDSGGKFTAGVVDTGGNLPLVSVKTPAVPVAKFPVGVLDTHGKFAGGVVDTENFPRIFKKFEMTLM